MMEIEVVVVAEVVEVVVVVAVAVVDVVAKEEVALPLHKGIILVYLNLITMLHQSFNLAPATKSLTSRLILTPVTILSLDS